MRPNIAPPCPLFPLPLRAFIVLLVSPLPGIVALDQHASSIEMRLLLNQQEELLHKLSKYVDSALQDKGASYRKDPVLLAMDKIRADSITLSHEETEHPLNVFLLFKSLRDLYPAWMQIAKDSAYEVSKVRLFLGILPTEEDLQGVALSLLRLQDVYDLDLEALVGRGMIKGVASTRALSKDECFYVSEMASRLEMKQLYQQWHKECLKKVSFEAERKVSS